MSQIDNTYQFVVWQRLVIQAQELALKMPGIGLNPDILPTLPIEQLTGVLAFLKRSYAEKQAS
ncbi:MULTISPECIES: hypothetical protein [unclassified Methylophaga]|jgi:hypothetical protein|uniref:hypothetical protein n=1 Tax=unclassified Methylophaga TaxID=2629249 RepID=UPI00259CA2BC|nr:MULTISPECIES: hypothetical protein [unclassified Methylophaga]|tara:strand:- start:2359 stop:2547 length:189 start_codon:yes stop_codon:yes gene_type:complete